MSVQQQQQNVRKIYRDLYYHIKHLKVHQQEKVYKQYIKTVQLQQQQVDNATSINKATTESSSLPVVPVQEEIMNVLRTNFRCPIVVIDNNNNTIEESINHRIKDAESKLSMLRITTSGVRTRNTTSASSTASTTDEQDSNNTSLLSNYKIQRWIYKNGKRYDTSNKHDMELLNKLVTNNSTYRVISPYDGKNLDPESVTKHRKNLKRAGFLNNQHAKGYF